jgi:hypothetical protein
LRQYGSYESQFDPEVKAEGASSWVDFVMEVDDKERLLVEAKSPSVMAQAQLPVNGMELTWDNRPGLARQLFTQASAISCSL